MFCIRHIYFLERFTSNSTTFKQKLVVANFKQIGQKLVIDIKLHTPNLEVSLHENRIVQSNLPCPQK